MGFQVLLQALGVALGVVNTEQYSGYTRYSILLVSKWQREPDHLVFWYQPNTQLQVPLLLSASLRIHNPSFQGEAK